MDILNNMNSLTIVFAALCIFAIAYRFYRVFLRDRVLRIDENKETPAYKCSDGKDYIATNSKVLFIGYGDMLTEGFVAIIALIATSTLIP